MIYEDTKLTLSPASILNKYVYYISQIQGKEAFCSLREIKKKLGQMCIPASKINGII